MAHREVLHLLKYVEGYEKVNMSVDKVAYTVVPRLIVSHIPPCI